MANYSANALDAEGVAPGNAVPAGGNAGSPTRASMARASRARVLIPRATAPEIVTYLGEHVDVDANQDDNILSREAFLDRLSDKDGVILTGERIDADVLSRAPRLRIASNMSVGFDNLDLPALTAAGVLGTNTPDILNESVADFGWALMMAAARRVAEADRFVRAGHWHAWSYDLMLGRDIHGSTLGIVGMGRIGQALAARAKGFGMRVIYHNRTRLSHEQETALNATWMPFDSLCEYADHVVAIVPLSASTRRLFDAEAFAKMRRGATFTHIGRGGVVDDAALAEALDSGHLAGAGLDVFENEPTILPALLRHARVVLAPHMAPATRDTRLLMARQACDNLLAGLGIGPDAGRPRHLLNPEALESRA